ncbi:hypothetical protein L2E82_34437 [Cichorium intybus]|uniref:Uncharacterized protein n=1 Tax=Cichorium intybus TaxID=13427 RepID=A0ACB9BM59_CICIN|nr:hypothetical protein L2E82_34437 [Cichorium intybus]
MRMNDTKSMGHQKVLKKVGEGFGKMKEVAATGAKKVKQGTSIGLQWIKDNFMLVTGEKENTVATSERVKSFKTDEDPSIRLTEVSVFELKKEEFASVTVVKKKVESRKVAMNNKENPFLRIISFL